jgi:sulfur-oxidizing protein SoxY
MDNSLLDRRAFVLGAAAAAAIAPLLAPRVAAQDTAQAWQEALKKVAGDVQPSTDKRLIFELPEIAENGNMVPFTISFDSPMTEKDHVRAIHVISTGNPQPSVASFRFTPMSGRATVASRMRLARTQDVIGLAELGDGRFVMTRRPVRVTIGGCGG